MIDALIAGKLFGQPQERTGKTGQPYVTAKVRAADGQGETHFVNAIAFGGAAREALLALGDGVALSGTLTPKIWTDNRGTARPSLDLQAHAVLTEYHVSRKRKSVAHAKDGATREHASESELAEDLDF